MIEIESVPETRTIATAAGRTVGYYEYGDPHGRPVLLLHGVPSCGAGFAWASAPGRERGLRLIAPDRPGVGLSDRSRARRVADYVPELEAFADALGLDRLAVLGYSGGGPYALAAAHALSDRIDVAGVAAGMGEVGTWASVRDFETTDRRMLTMSARRPRTARAILAAGGRLASMSPRAALRSFAAELSPSDRELIPQLGEPAEAMALFTRVFLRSAWGAVDDYVRIGRPWGFAPEEIAVPVWIWQGTADTMVPSRHADELAARVPGARLVKWSGEGHLAPVAHVGELLDAMAAAPIR